MERELEIAVSLAHEASEVIIDVYRSGFSVESKGDEGPVTEADRAANRLIVQGLSEAFPSDAILSEEAPDDLARLQSSRLWLVDPLDGTNQFIQHIDEFAIMLGLAIEGRAVLGVVHFPTEGRTFTALRSSGAFVDEPGGVRRRLTLPSVTKSVDGLAMAVSRAHFGARTRRALEVAGATQVVRSGSVGRKAMLVADGTVDAYITLGSRSRHWDACACDVIVSEAGGRFLDTRGRRLAYNTREVRNLGGLLACRVGLEDRLLAAIATARA